MSENNTSDTGVAQEAVDEQKQSKGLLDRWRNADPVRRFTWTLITLIVLLFFWYIAADRVAPWTDQARVQGWIVPISPKVSGKVKEVTVVQDQEVKAGDLLAVIDPVPYELALQRAEAAVTLAGQDIGAATAAVETAVAGVVEAKAKLDEYEVQLARLESIGKKGAISKAQLDSARAEREKASAQLSKARGELERAKQALGIQGDENPRMKDALAALGQAQIDLKGTKIKAPADGGITNLKIDKGYYAKAGSPLMTFVAFDDVWIQANFRENSVGNIQVGDPVDISLDMLPGRILKGTVTSKAFAVKQPTGGMTGDVISVKGSSGWLRDAQRFPVLIKFDDESGYGYRMSGGQADVQVYTQESNWLMNGLGWLWIRFMSLMSYVY